MYEGKSRMQKIPYKVKYYVMAKPLYKKSLMR